MGIWQLIVQAIVKWSIPDYVRCMGCGTMIGKRAVYIIKGVDGMLLVKCPDCFWKVIESVQPKLPEYSGKKPYPGKKKPDAPCPEHPVSRQAYPLSATGLNLPKKMNCTFNGSKQPLNSAKYIPFSGAAPIKLKPVVGSVSTFVYMGDGLPLQTGLDSCINELHKHFTEAELQEVVADVSMGARLSFKSSNTLLLDRIDAVLFSMKIK